MIKKIKGTGAALMMGCLMMSVSGCTGEKQAAAERAPLATEKNIGDMVNEAGKTEESVDYTTDGAAVPEGTAAKTKKIDDFSTILESDNGVIKVDVDAPVNLTECDSYPLVKVTRNKIDSETMKKAKEALLGDVQLYDGIRVMDPEIERVKKSGEDLWSIDESQYRGLVCYEDVSAYPVDTELFSVNEKAADYSDTELYGWYYSDLARDGELFYGVTDGSDGSYASFSVINTENYGSSLKFFKSKDYFVPNGLVLPCMNVYTWPVEKGIEYVGDFENNPETPIGEPSAPGEPEFDEEGNVIQIVGSGDRDPDFKGYRISESTKETNNLSKEEALQQAEEMLEKLGYGKQYIPVTAEDSYLIGYDNVVNTKADDGTYTYDVTAGRAWDIVFERGVNGNAVKDYGEKYADSYSGGDYSKTIWSGEYVEMMVNDNGVVGLIIGDPLTAEETVVENSKLKDFEEIKDIYMASQLEVLNSMPSFDSFLYQEAGPMEFNIKITDISLSYTKVSEPNDFSGALLVPVWDFSGVCYDAEGKLIGEGSFIQINAIDGTVYSASAGY